MWLNYVVVNQNELYHARSHKYIKREWKNGGWRYYYSNGLRLSPSQAKQGQLDAASAYKTALENDSKGRIILKPGGREALTRNMAAHLQEVGRIEAYEREQKKPINVAKVTLKSISTAAGSAYDKGKNWLSKVLSTPIVSTTTTIRDSNGKVLSEKSTPGLGLGSIFSKQTTIKDKNGKVISSRVSRGWN